MSNVYFAWVKGRTSDREFVHLRAKNVLYKESYLILHFVNDRVSRGSNSRYCHFLPPASLEPREDFNSIQAVSFELLEISRWSQIFYIDVEVWSLTYRLAFGIFLLFFVEKKDASIQRFSVRSKKLLRNPKTVQSHFVSSWNVDRIDFAHFPPLKMPSPSHPKYLLLWSYSTMPFSYTSNLL